MGYNKDMAIILAPHDSYLDVFTEYMKYFKANWSDCPFELILCTNTKKYDDDRVVSVTTSEQTQWTGRVKVGVNLTDCKYILVCMEDGFISKRVDNNYIFSILSQMRKNNIVYYRNPKDNEEHIIGPDAFGFEHAYRIDKTEIYGVNNGYVIWERNELLKVLEEGTKTAWQIEDDFNKLAMSQHKGFYDNYISDKTNFLHIIETVSHGQWIPQELKRLQKLGVKVNIGKRTIMPQTKTYLMALYRLGDRIIPRKNRVTIKKILKKIGFKFVTDY